MFGVLEVNRSRTPWVVAGLLLLGTAAFVLYSFIGTFVFGLFFYYATRPVYRRLKRRVRPRSLAAGIAICTLALPFVALAAYTGAIGLQELDRFTDTIQNGNGTLGQYEAMLQPYLNVSSIVDNPQTLLDDSAARDVLQRVLAESQQYVLFIGTALLHLFIMAALAFYLLLDGRKLSRWVKATFGDDRGVMDAYFRAVDRDFSSIFFGNILNAFITGIIGALTYSLLNVYAPSSEVLIPYAALVGLLCGAASLVPVVGMKLVYVPVSAYLFAKTITADATGLVWFPVLFVAVSFLIVDVIPDLVLRPYVSGRNLHVGAVMFAYILGPLLFGWYGLFLGPVILVLGVHFVRLVLPELIHSERIQPYAVDPTYIDDDDAAGELAAGGEPPVDVDAVASDEAAAADDAGDPTPDGGDAA